MQQIVHPSFFYLTTRCTTRIKSQNVGTSDCTRDPPLPQDYVWFLPRNAMQAQSLLSCSVCPSHLWITSKRINISLKFFHHRVETPF